MFVHWLWDIPTLRKEKDSKMTRANLLKFLFGASTVLYLQFVQSFLLHRGFDERYLGYVYAATCVLDILVSIPTGALADRYGVKRISVFGIAILLLASFLAFITTGWIVLLIGYLVYKVAESTLNGVITLWARHLPQKISGATTGSIFTRLDQWQRVGMITTAMIVGFIIKDSGFSSRGGWVFSFLVSVVFLIVALRTEKISTSVGKTTFSKVIQNLKSSLTGTSALKVAMSGIFLLGLAEGLVGAKYWAWIKQIGINGPLSISIIVVLSSVSRVTGQLFLGRYISNERKRFFFSLMAISFISFIFSTALPPIALVAFWFFRIFCYAPYFPLLNKELEEVSHKSIHSTVLSSAPTLNGVGAALGAFGCSHWSINSQISFGLIGTFCMFSTIMWHKALSMEPDSRTKILILEGMPPN